LQLIHLHAGKYYSERGLLSATVRSRGKGKDKKNKDKVLVKNAESRRQSDLLNSSEEDSDNSTNSESETESAEEEHNRPTERLRSMNRALDGSALLAIGTSREPPNIPRLHAA
jgi:hypothetical protein